MFCGVPLWSALRRAGAEVHLANYSFAYLDGDTADAAPHGWYRVRPETPTEGFPRSLYQPERHLARWLQTKGAPAEVWALPQMGVAPARTAWAWLIDHLGVDTVVAVDGGTDALLSGVESGLGTPAEDVTTMLGLYAAAGPVRKLLVCAGFGVDAHHGVAHAEVLEAIAALDAGGYWAD